MRAAERLKRQLLYSRTNRRLIAWTAAWHPPGFAGLDLFRISRFFFRAIHQGELVTRASAIAFRLFLALFPGLLVLLTLIPFIPVPHFQETLLLSFRELLPVEVYRFIEGLLHDLLVKKHSTLLSVSFVLGIFFASNSIAAILDGFSASYQVTTWHSPLKQRLWSLGLLFVLAVLCVMAAALLTLGSWTVSELRSSGIVLNAWERGLFFFLKGAVAVLLTLCALSLLYFAGDPTAKRFRLFTPGAILALVLVFVLSQGLAFMFDHITDYNALYGSIGAIIAVQIWLYLNMIVILVGYELNASIAMAKRRKDVRTAADRSVRSVP
ncbi:MAG TPA: YihY/virulence factor BrkB family protein [Flavobacteriales bacterium]